MFRALTGEDQPPEVVTLRARRRPGGPLDWGLAFSPTGRLPGCGTVFLPTCPSVGRVEMFGKAVATTVFLIPGDVAGAMFETDGCPCSGRTCTA